MTKQNITWTSASGKVITVTAWVACLDRQGRDTEGAAPMIMWTATIDGTYHACSDGYREIPQQIIAGNAYVGKLGNIALTSDNLAALVALEAELHSDPRFAAYDAVLAAAAKIDDEHSAAVAAVDSAMTLNGRTY